MDVRTKTAGNLTAGENYNIWEEQDITEEGKAETRTSKQRTNNTNTLHLLFTVVVFIFILILCSALLG